MLRNEEPNFRYSTKRKRTVKQRRVSWVGYVGRIEPIRNAYTIYAGETEAKTLLEICNSRWEKNCNIKIRCVDIDYGLESYFRIGPSG
jgi:hypothetical protein